MQANRKARLESVILQELTVLIRGLKDPRIPMLTITDVTLTDDARQVTVKVTLFGGGQDSEREDEEMREAIKGLTSASGFLRRQIAQVIQIRHIPNFIFKADRGLENSLRVHEILNDLNKNEGFALTDPSKVIVKLKDTDKDSDDSDEESEE